MSIKNKSNLLVGLFVLLLVLNGVGIFMALEKIKTANEHIVKTTYKSNDFFELRHTLKTLQEVSTDASLVSDKEGIAELESLKESYHQHIKNLSKHALEEIEKNALDAIESTFEKYFIALKNLALAGINEEGKTKIYSTMEAVDGLYETIEKNIETIIENEKNFLTQSVEEDFKTIALAEKIFIALSVVFLFAVIYLSLSIKGILANILKLDHGVIELLDPETNVKVEIHTQDEIGNISKNFNLYVDRLEKAQIQDRVVIEEARKVMGKVNAGLLNDRILHQAHSKEVAGLVHAINQMIETMQKNITTISHSLVHLSLSKNDVEIPRLEKVSGLKFNQDFFAGYSPERINPGDKLHRVTNILKITSGSTPEVADFVDQIYNLIIEAGTHKAASIKVAEAAKVIENTQRDVNIALINELAVIFNKRSAIRLRRFDECS